MMTLVHEGETMREDKKIFAKGLVVGILVLVWGYTVVSGGMALYRRHFSEDISVYDKIAVIHSILEHHFVGDVDPQAMEDAMFAGLLYGVGDRYTSYMNSAEFARFMELSRGTYVGIGAVVTRGEDGSVIIVSPHRNSPAYLGGLLPGDRIREVDGIDIREKSDLSLIIGMIQGPEGTQVNLTIYREMESRSFNVDLTRAVVEIPTIDYELKDGNLGFIRMSGFDAVTYQQFVDAFESLESQGMEGLILDLRNNPGGRLDTVVRITDRLVPEGLIVYTEDAHGNRRELHSEGGHIEMPFVILMNGNSASASEVLAGAAQDHGVATIVGEQSFGKGLVQDIFPLPDGSAIRVTVATYYTPLGRSIHDIGLTPDVVVEMDEALSANLARIEREEDVQLQRAIEVILAKIGE